MFFWGNIISNVPANFQKNGQMRAIYSSEVSVPDQWGLPVGYYSGWMLPRKAGYVVGFSENELSSTGNAVMWVNWTGSSSFSFTGLADLSLVVSATGICNIVITSTGEIVWSLYATGTSWITLWAVWTIWANAFWTGISTIAVSGSGNIFALWIMSGSMNPFTELSPEWLANAVWSALATENNIANTMWAKLNTASSGWVDLNALAQAVWEYTVRSLTESGWLSPTQAAQLEATVKTGDTILNLGDISIPL